MKKIKLTYFKTTGSYYTEGSYETEKESWHGIVQEVEEMHREGKLPGLAEGCGRDLMVHVNAEEAGFCVPHIIV